jgi:hypothetical protein
VDVLLQCLDRSGLTIKFLQELGYNGDSAISGKPNGIRTHTAVYVHCVACFLNMAISKFCSLVPPEIAWQLLSIDFLKFFACCSKHK